MSSIAGELVTGLASLVLSVSGSQRFSRVLWLDLLGVLVHSFGSVTIAYRTTTANPRFRQLSPRVAHHRTPKTATRARSASLLRTPRFAEGVVHCPLIELCLQSRESLCMPKKAKMQSTSSFGQSASSRRRQICLKEGQALYKLCFVVWLPYSCVLCCNISLLYSIITLLQKPFQQEPLPCHQVQIDRFRDATKVQVLQKAGFPQAPWINSSTNEPTRTIRWLLQALLMTKICGPGGTMGQARMLTASIKATLRAVRLLTMVIFQGRSGHGKAKELTNLLSWLIHR